MIHDIPKLTEFLKLPPYTPPDPNTMDWTTANFPYFPVLPYMVASLGEYGGWTTPQVVQAGSIPVHPANDHYSQRGFEGMQTQVTADGSHAIITGISQHFDRLCLTARGMAMQALPDDVSWFAGPLQELVRLTMQAGYVPPHGEGVIYLRPHLQPLDCVTGVSSAQRYLFTVIAWAMPLPRHGMRKLWISRDHHRGGSYTGHLKAGANYGPTLLLSEGVKAAYKARNTPIAEVLYAEQDSFTLGETGTTFVYFLGPDGTLYHSPLGRRTFLDSISARMVVEIHKHVLGLQVREADVTLDWLKDGRIAAAATVGNIGGVHHVTDVYVQGDYQPIDLATMTLQIQPSMDAHVVFDPAPNTAEILAAHARHLLAYRQGVLPPVLDRLAHQITRIPLT